MTYVTQDGVNRTFYDILGVTVSASDKDIKAAYKQKLLSTHPDKVHNQDIKDGEAIILIKEAYRTLIDSKLRKEYNESVKKTAQRSGFNLNGDGLDTYDLNDFRVEEAETGKDVLFYKDCPRCQFPSSICLTESDLSENGTDDDDGGFELIVQCESCSLWIKVKYYEDYQDDNI